MNLDRPDLGQDVGIRAEIEALKESIARIPCQISPVLGRRSREADYRGGGRLFAATWD